MHNKKRAEHLRLRISTVEKALGLKVPYDAAAGKVEEGGMSMIDGSSSLMMMIENQEN